jgi:HEAT repeat protein
MAIKSIPLLLLVSSLASLPACAGGVDDADRTDPADAAAPREAEAREPATVTTAPEAVAAAPRPAVRQWRPWVEAEVERLRSERPDYFDQVMALPVRTTRAGFPRLTGPLVRDPDAAPILLHRLLSRGESADTRAAIVETLPRTRGDWSAAVAELMALETDPRVRELLCSALYHAQAPYALEGLARGLEDSAAAVRAEALRSLGRRADDGEQLASGIIAALSDPDEAVQQEAARALGNLEVAAAADALVGKLSSSSADVRRHSLRALSRIDPERARTLPELQVLRADADPKVARLAEQLATAP